MNVLIVGGTGVISTGITRELLEEGHEVTHYRRGETDSPVGTEDVKTIRGDRTDRERFERQIRATDGFDCAIDMVCFDPADAESDVRAFESVADQVIFCSTVDVYSRPVEGMPITEDAPHDPAASEYGADKSACEDVFFAAHDRDAFDVTVIRPWSTYSADSGVLHTFGDDPYYLERIRRGLPIVVHGDGTSVWGPCHRDDVARAFANAVGNPEATGEAYHVTAEEVLTWNEYYRTLADAMDAPEPDLVHVPTAILRAVVAERTEMLAAHFQYSTTFDTTKAERDLNFAQTVPWSEGVREALEYLTERDRIRGAEAVERDDHLIERWRELTDEYVATNRKDTEKPH